MKKASITIWGNFSEKGLISDVLLSTLVAVSQALRKVDCKVTCTHNIDEEEICGDDLMSEARLIQAFHDDALVILCRDTVYNRDALLKNLQDLREALDPNILLIFVPVVTTLNGLGYPPVEVRTSSRTVCVENPRNDEQRFIQTIRPYFE